MAASDMIGSAEAGVLWDSSTAHREQDCGIDGWRATCAVRKKNQPEPSSAAVSGPSDHVDVFGRGVRKPQADQGRNGGTDEPMSTLDGARQRLESALERLETAIRDNVRRDGAQPAAAASDSEAMLARDLELLRAECGELRQALDEALSSRRALADTVGEVTGKLDRTIGELADIVEG
jgi:hypothetical protein